MGFPRGEPVTLIRVVAALAAIAIFAAALVQADDKSRGIPSADKVLVYFMQTDGPRRHLFSRQEWLGVLHNGAYFFTHMDPG